MRLTKQRVQWMAALTDEMFDVAHSFCEDGGEDGRYRDLVIDRDEASISFDSDGYCVEGEYFDTQECGCCSDYVPYYINVPWAYIVDPVGWKEDEEERKHQENLEKIRKRQQAEILAKRRIKAGEEARLAELIGKYPELAQTLLNCEGI